MPKAPERILVVDSLRGLAALAVALFHFNEGVARLTDPYHRLVSWGWLGVPVFFVLSGYCIAAAATQAPGRVTTFWFRRLARIFPPYWASLLLVLVLVVARRLSFGTNDLITLPHDVSGWLYTGLALTKPASSVMGINWVYWSLAYELAFYVAMGLSFLTFGRVWLLALTLACFVLPGYPFDQWCLFGLGVGCYQVLKKADPVALLLLAACAVQACLNQSMPVALLALLTALLLLYPAPLAMLVKRSPFPFLGTFSYSLYLVHVPIGCMLLSRMFTIGRESLPSALLRDSLLLALVGCFAYVFFLLFEKPTHAWARRTAGRIHACKSTDLPGREPVPPATPQQTENH